MTYDYCKKWILSECLFWKHTFVKITVNSEKVSFTVCNTKCFTKCHNTYGKLQVSDYG